MQTRKINTNPQAFLKLPLRNIKLRHAYTKTQRDLIDNDPIFIGKQKIPWKNTFGPGPNRESDRVVLVSGHNGVKPRTNAEFEITEEPRLSAGLSWRSNRFNSRRSRYCSTGGLRRRRSLKDQVRIAVCAHAHKIVSPRPLVNVIIPISILNNTIYKFSLLN